MPSPDSRHCHLHSATRQVPMSREKQADPERTVEETEVDAISLTSNSTTTTSAANDTLVTVDCSSDDDDEEEAEADEDEYQRRHEPVCILGEVVSGFRLTRDDPLSSDKSSDDDSADLALRGAFCVVKFGTETIHKTKSAKAGSNWRNPVWTLSTHSLFTFTTTPHELAHTELHVSVWFKRQDPLMITVLETCFLGKATINGLTLLQHCNEQLYNIHLCDYDQNSYDDEDLDASSARGGSRGSISLRFRLAAPSDEQLVRQINTHPNVLNNPGSTELFHLLHSPPTPLPSTEDRPLAPILTEQDETQIAGANFVQALSTVFVSKRLLDQESGQTKVRVKPHPDPNRPESTTWLSRQEFKSETLKPSQQWIEAGSGTLGKLYLEILSCHDLPNVDVGEAVGNLTDAFVCAVLEDAMVQTPVIDDELSPHWLPWTQRAFVFGMRHPASLLHLGVFDYDLGPVPHEALGRISIPIGKFQRDTDYTLQYNLHKSSNVTDRTPSGSITIRIRLEIADEKQALLAALRPRPKFHINVRREKTHAVVRYTCFGEFGEDKEDSFDLTVARSYVNEILEYRSVLSYCLSDTIQSLLFWEGQVRVFGIWLPLHSILLFVWGTVLLERPYLLPSFCLLSVAWIMLATQTCNQQHPSPWRRCPSFWHYLKILYFGKSSLPVRRICVNEGAGKADEYEKQWADRIEKDQKVAQARVALQEEIDLIGDETIHTKGTNGGIPLDLLVRCTRYQKLLARVCRFLRFIKIIVTWEEHLVSFWITASFLLGGLASMLLPWTFIIRWAARIFVYGVLGPHMKIVGIIVLRDDVKDDEAIRNIIDSFREKSLGARQRHQEAVKLKDMLSFSFGPYSTLTPAFNLSRHHDYPLPASYARLRYPKSSAKLDVAKHYIPGQHCSGVIIPRIGIAARKFDDELPRLAGVRDDILESVRRIQEEDNYELIKRLRSLGSEEKDLPDAIGYELVSLLDRNEPKLDSSETNIALGEASSLHLNAYSNVAVISERRRSAYRKSLQSSHQFGFELVTMKNGKEDDENECLRLGPTSTLLPSSDRRLAIVETSECRPSVCRRSFRPMPMKMLQRAQGSPAEIEVSPTVSNDVGEEIGVEVILQNSNPVGICGDTRPETSDNLLVLYHILVPTHEEEEKHRDESAS